ncbi:MAG: hypothetical protein OCC49_01355 [Fibrobacterales bacterium]
MNTRIYLLSILLFLLVGCGDNSSAIDALSSDLVDGESSVVESSDTPLSSEGDVAEQPSSDGDTQNADTSSSSENLGDTDSSDESVSSHDDTPDEVSSSTGSDIEYSSPRVTSCSPFAGSYPHATEVDTEPVYAIFVDGDIPVGSKRATATLNDNGMLNIDTSATYAQNSASNRWATPDQVECAELTEGNKGWLFDVNRLTREDSTRVDGFFMVHSMGWRTVNLSSVTALKFDVKATQPLSISVESTNLEEVTHSGTTTITEHTDGEWHSVTIPVAEFGADIEWEFTRIFFKVGGLTEDGPIYIDNMRYAGYVENSKPVIKGDTEIAVSGVGNTEAITLTYSDDDDDEAQWTVLSEPSFGTVSISTNADGDIEVSYTNTDDSSVDAFKIEFHDGHKNYIRKSFSVSVSGGLVKPIGVYTDNNDDAFVPLSLVGWWQGGGSEKESDREGVAGDMLWDGGAGSGGIYFDFTPSGFIDIGDMETLSFDINFYDTASTEWGLDKVLFIVSLEDKMAQPTTEWSRYAVEYSAVDDIPLNDEWQTITIDLQHGSETLSYTNSSGTLVTTDKENIMTFSIGIYNGGGSFQLDNVVFNPKE